MVNECLLLWQWCACSSGVVGLCGGAWSLVWCSVVLCCGGLTYRLTMHQGRFQKRSEVQCGDVGRRVEVRGCATRPQVRSIKPCSPSATCVTTNQMEQSGEKPRKRVGSIAHRVDHSLFATTSSKQQAAPRQAQVHVHVRVEVKVEVEASRGRESITEGRGGEMDQ